MSGKVPHGVNKTAQPIEGAAAAVITEEKNKMEELKAEVEMLEAKLKKKTEQFEKLKEERNEAKAHYEREIEDSVDIISIAKRNVENQLSKILELKQERKALDEQIEAEKARLQREEQETRARLAEEEENITRDVVVLQTKLLMLEGDRLEGDRLLAQIGTIEKVLADKEEEYQEKLDDMRQVISEKCDKLSKEMTLYSMKLAEESQELAVMQQLVAVKQMHKHVIGTEKKYKEASERMLRSLDTHKELKQRLRVEQEFEITEALIDILTRHAEQVGKKLKGLTERYEEQNRVMSTQKLHWVEEEKHLNEQLKDVENQLFETEDNISELQLLLNDQTNYMNMLVELEEQQKDFNDRLAPVLSVAEEISKKGSVELPVEANDPLERYAYFQKLTAILLESGRIDDKSYDAAVMDGITPVDSIEEIHREAYHSGLMGLVPLSSFKPAYSARKRSPAVEDARTPSVNLPMYRKGMDPVQTKILNELGLLKRRVNNSQA